MLFSTSSGNCAALFIKTSSFPFVIAEISLAADYEYLVRRLIGEKVDISTLRVAGSTISASRMWILSRCFATSINLSEVFLLRTMAKTVFSEDALSCLTNSN